MRSPPLKLKKKVNDFMPIFKENIREIIMKE